METVVPKLYRVFFDDGKPLFAEFYSAAVLEVYPVGIFGKKLIEEHVYEFLIVLANDENDALIKAKKDAEKNL